MRLTLICLLAIAAAAPAMAHAPTRTGPTAAEVPTVPLSDAVHDDFSEA